MTHLVLQGFVRPIRTHRIVVISKSQINSPSKPKIQANPTSTAFHAVKPPTSHHASRCLLTSPSSPRVSPDVKLKNPALSARLLKTTNTKRADWGIRSDRVFWRNSFAGSSARVSAVAVTADKTSFLRGVMVGYFRSVVPSPMRLPADERMNRR